MKGGPGTSDPGRIIYLRVNMRLILPTAFGLQDDQINGPAWVLNNDLRSSDKYDIEAIVPPGTTKEQANVMMQNLLKERFNLAFHIEKKNLDAYQLVVAKGGPKLRGAAEADGPLPPRPNLEPSSGGFPRDQDGFPQLPAGRPDIVATTANGHVRIAGRMATTTGLLNTIAVFLGSNHVVDKTGLTGRYDFKLDYSTVGMIDPLAAVRPAPVQPGADAIDLDPIPDLFTAVERQLGLRLEKTKAPFDVVVIDHIDKTPTEN